MNNKLNKKELNPTQEKIFSSPEQSRRELATKLGKFAIYAAPFTVMALNNQAKAASGPQRGKP